jgi:uncharacterized protein (TIGR02594 family)
MDNVILDVVIGLLLVYLVLALMVSKLQETIFGQWFTSRQRTLHDMLDEALGQDKTLKTRLLENPAIRGLYQGDTASTGLRDKGPSAIPSDLFARALLVEVYNDGAHSHPSRTFESPQLFVNTLAAQQNPPKILGTLLTLLPGSEAKWSALESAIATWFDQVGDRANGWYQRKALRRSFWVAFGAALVFNADSFQLAERFAGDPELRRSLVALAQRTVADFGPAQAGATPATVAAPVLLAPALRADQALERASAQLVELYFKNAKLAGFDPNRQALKPAPGESMVDACARAKSTLVVDRSEPLSNPKTWMQLLPPLRTAIKQLRLPERFESDMPPATTLTASPAASQPVRWCRAGSKCEIDQTAIDGAAAQAASVAASRFVTEAGEALSGEVVKQLAKRLKAAPAEFPAPAERRVPTREQQLRHAYLCLSNLVGWVDMAMGAAPEDASLMNGLRTAAARFNEAGDALQEMIEDQGSGLLVRQMFMFDPEAFSECAQLPGMSRARLRACMASADTGRLNLPLGWTGRNIRQALCHTVELVPGSAPASACPLGQAHTFAGHAGLGLKPLGLQGPGFLEWALLLIGVVVTAVFVSLGAPFWFDLLGRVVKLRASGSRPATEAEQLSARESVTSDRAEQDKGGEESFSDARNEFERLLTRGDKIEVQHAVGAIPTGRLDEATRSALLLRARELGLTLTPVDELSLQAYLRLVGKRPAALENVGQDEEDRTSTAGQWATLKPHQLAQRVAALAPQLAAGLGFAAERAIPAAEQRALAMLYLFKQARRAQAKEESPSRLRLNLKARVGMLSTLDKWDHETLQALAQVPAASAAGTVDQLFAREAMPWLDWALGELGQTQLGGDSRASSNPRVIAYLEAAGMSGDFGDNTDWCAAFVSWVIAQHNGERPGQKLPDKPGEHALRAVSWQNWGFAREGDPQPGDVLVLFRNEGKTQHHVALVLETRGEWTYVIGGNQDDPGCVCIGGWRHSSIAAQRKPFDA